MTFDPSLTDQIEQLREELNGRIDELQAKPLGSNFALRQYNPLVTRGAGRIIMEIPFDDSLDSSFSLECFFQMPAQTRAIRAAKLWVARKNFRTYTASGASTSAGGGTVSGNPSTGHGHTETTQPANTGVASPPISDGHWHGYNDASAQLTANESIFHTHTTDISHNHTISLTTGIFESAAAGTMSLFVADDGINYGTAITTGVTTISNQELKPQLTKTPGDKRIKLTATGLMRVQVLLMLDLRVSVIG